MKKCATLIMFLISLQLFAPNERIDIKFEQSKFIEVQLNNRALINTTKEVIKIASIIKKHESDNNYQAIGASGEYGAYQFMYMTWEQYCYKFLGKVVLQTEINQDIIAFAKINDLLMEGYSSEQIASIWNSGKPEYENKIGYNKMNVYYNVPAYVEKFMNEYNKMI